MEVEIVHLEAGSIERESARHTCRADLSICAHEYAVEERLSLSRCKCNKESCNASNDHERAFEI